MKKADVIAASGTLTGMQIAALCYRRDRRGKISILLITSRDTGRWVLPKGWPIKGMDAAEAAAREAFEEAGVEGKVGTDCAGVYTYDKLLTGDTGLPVMVAVYPLKIARLARNFPEKGQRKLKWFRRSKAATCVDEPDLAAILAAFDPRRLPENRRAGT